MDFPKASSKKEWVLSKEAFDRLLAILDTNRDRAAEKYEEIRLKLLKYFQWSGSQVPDIDADETIDRVTRRIEEGANVYNVNGYIYGVAKLVNAESLRQRSRNQALDAGQLVELASVGVDAEAAKCRECLARCLQQLSDEDREMIVEYYRYEKADRIPCRKQLAEKLGVSLNTLRIKTHRQRLSLEACVERCLGRYD